MLYHNSDYTQHNPQANKYPTIRATFIMHAEILSDIHDVMSEVFCYISLYKIGKSRNGQKSSNERGNRFSNKYHELSCNKTKSDCEDNDQYNIIYLCILYINIGGDYMP
eukprot:491758_1